MEAKTRKIRVVKTKGRREDGGKGYEVRGKEKNKEKKEEIMEIKRVIEKWKIWDDNDETAKSEEEAKKLVSLRFHKWIYVFRKKVSISIVKRRKRGDI